jgi:hypothetical protein
MAVMSWSVTDDGDTRRVVWVPGMTTEEVYRIYYPHTLRYGPVTNVYVGPPTHDGKLTQSDGPWQAQCGCGYRGRVGTWAAADADMNSHDYTANTSERGAQP